MKKKYRIIDFSNKQWFAGKILDHKGLFTKDKAKAVSYWTWRGTMRVIKRLQETWPTVNWKVDFPAMMTHPGETVKEVLEERRISVRKLSTEIGYREEYIKNVIEGKQRITDGFAYALGRVTDVPMSFFINLQRNHDEEYSDEETGK